METVADHQPVASLVDLLTVGVDVRGDLGQHRRGQHLTSAVTSELVKQRPTHRRRGVLVGLGLFLDYLSLDAPSRTDAPTPVMIRELWIPDLPREGASLHVTRPRAIHRSTHRAPAL